MMAVYEGGNGLVLVRPFSRLANAYTLATVCLCFFDFSPVTPISSITPLLIVLTTSAVKEIVEDFKRRAQDRMYGHGSAATLSVVHRAFLDQFRRIIVRC
jgi:hypothetical protein